MNEQPPPQPQAQVTEATRIALHTRAGQSSDELRKTLLTLSAGAIGVFFVTLTGDKATSLSSWEVIFLCLAITAFGLAIGSGIIAFEYAGRAFYDKAKKNDPEFRDSNHATMLRYHNLLLYCFASGVFTSAGYLIIRIFFPPVK